jgi:hypothetical protein
LHRLSMGLSFFDIKGFKMNFLAMLCTCWLFSVAQASDSVLVTPTQKAQEAAQGTLNKLESDKLSPEQKERARQIALRKAWYSSVGGHLIFAIVAVNSISLAINIVLGGTVDPKVHFGFLASCGLQAASVMVLMVGAFGVQSLMDGALDLMM